MGDKSRGSLISCCSAQEPASPIQSWMGSLANILRFLATAVLPLGDRGRRPQVDAGSTERRNESR